MKLFIQIQVKPIYLSGTISFKNLIKLIHLNKNLLLCVNYTVLLKCQKNP